MAFLDFLISKNFLIAAKPRAQARVKRTPVQILVVVANIQVRPLKTEVEKGSM